MAFGDFKGIPFLDNSELPNPTSVGLDKSTSDLIQSKYDQAMRNPEEIKQEHLGQIKEAADSGYKGFLGNDAIKQKYGALLSQDLKNFGDTTVNNLRERQSNRYKMAQQALMAQQQITNDAFARQMDAYNQREAARAQAISSIIGAGAMIGGAYLGGMGGAAAGGVASGGLNSQGYGRGNNRMTGGGDFNEMPGYNRSMDYRENLRSRYG